MSSTNDQYSTVVSPEDSNLGDGAGTKAPACSAVDSPEPPCDNVLYLHLETHGSQNALSREPPISLVAYATPKTLATFRGKTASHIWPAAKMVRDIYFDIMPLRSTLDMYPTDGETNESRIQDLLEEKQDFWDGRLYGHNQDKRPNEPELTWKKVPQEWLDEHRVESMPASDVSMAVPRTEFFAKGWPNRTLPSSAATQ